LSSWVKWRVVATGIIFAAVFVPAGVGAIVSAVLRTKWGLLLNLPFMMSDALAASAGRTGVHFEVLQLPTGAIVAMFVLACFLCSGHAQCKRIRAREVVRG
jgi:putative effector of murein hydrolase LrgA (UPF0299 family)